MRTIISKSLFDQKCADLARMPERKFRQAKPTDDPVDDALHKAIQAAKSGSLTTDQRGLLIACGLQPEMILTKSGPCILSGFGTPKLTKNEEELKKSAKKKGKQTISEDDLIKSLNAIEKVALSIK